MVDEAQRQRTNFRNINPNDFIDREPYRPDFNRKIIPPFGEPYRPDPNRKIIPPFGEPYRPDPNKRPPKDFPTGIMLAMSNNPTMDKIKNIYNRVDPFIPDIDIDDREIGYDYEKDLGPGTFNIGGNYDFDDNQYDFNLGYKMTFDDGGIATLPTPEGMQKRERVPLTDEQKDYLYDYMLNFMFKQKQREQQEMEGRIPPFNYEGLEV